jgi:hypothetical protein
MKFAPLSADELNDLDRAHASSTPSRWGANSTTLFVGTGKDEYRVQMPQRAQTGRDTSADQYFMALAHERVPHLTEEIRALRAEMLPDQETLARELCEADRHFASVEEGFPLERYATWERFADDDPTKREYLATAAWLITFFQSYRGDRASALR